MPAVRQQLFHFLQVVLPLGKDLPPVDVCKSSTGIQHVHTHAAVIMAGYMYVMYLIITKLHACTRANRCALIYISGFSLCMKLLVSILRRTNIADTVNVEPLNISLQT